MAAEIVKAHMESSTHTELKISSMRKVPNFEFEEVYGSEVGFFFFEKLDNWEILKI